MPQCILCREKPAQKATHPFCSRLCQDRDLLNWLDGAYVAEGEAVSQNPSDADGANSFLDDG